VETGAVNWRLQQGRLHRVHRGVYAVGHTQLTLRGRQWAALLATGGPGSAVLSHRTAAAVWDLLPSPAGRLDVTTLRAAESTSAIRVHRSRTIAGDITERHSLAVTTPTRTLIDLADQLTPHRLERVCHRAEVLRLLDARSIATRMEELPGRRTVQLRAALATLEHADPQITRSDLEERFLSLVAECELPRPRANALLHGFEVDFLWKDARLAVETDGGAVHARPRARERDHRRDATLTILGYRVHRFTWNQVIREPGAVVRTLRALLDRGAA
jgi:very-short-patch-repair endonuclease